MHPNTSFSHKKNLENYPFPLGRGHPSPYLVPQVPSLQLDAGYAPRLSPWVIWHFTLPEHKMYKNL